VLHCFTTFLLHLLVHDFAAGLKAAAEVTTLLALITSGKHPIINQI